MKEQVGARRALIVVRLSRVTDATTSPARQLEECRKLCEQRGYEIVGIAEDLDVSGAIDPFDREKRPSLSRWLANDAEPFDVLVAYRVDRFTRSIRHLQELVHWADDHGKVVVSATEPHFDTTSPFAAVVIALMGTVAQMELDGIRERNTSAAQYNIRAGKYRGGLPPWGYLPSDDSGEWRLVQDDKQVEVIEQVVKRVLAGETLRAIAHDLTGQQILTPRDRFAQSQNRDVKHYEWSPGSLKRSLTSPTLLGQVVAREALADAQGRTQRDAKSKKKFGPEMVVRNEDGSPVVRAEPILSREVFERVGAELVSREIRREPTTRSSGLLLQVIYCGVCGRPAYRLKGGPGRQSRYRCASAQYRDQCTNKSIALAEADKLVEGSILALLGDSERLDRVWESGSDHSAELAEVNDILGDLTGQLGAGPFKAGTPQRARLDLRIAELAARQEALSKEAVKPAGWTWQGTGEKFRDWWTRQDVNNQNIWLRSMGIRLDFRCKSDGRHVEIEGLSLDLGDINQLTEQLHATGAAADWRHVMDGMKQSGVAGVEIKGDRAVLVSSDGSKSEPFDLSQI